jgi:hypothetical protein
MPASTPADFIDRAINLIRAASQTDRDDQKVRCFQEAEIWLQLAKHQLVIELKRTTSSLPRA